MLGISSPGQGPNGWEADCPARSLALSASLGADPGPLRLHWQYCHSPLAQGLEGELADNPPSPIHPRHTHEGPGQTWPFPVASGSPLRRAFALALMHPSSPPKGLREQEASWVLAVLPDARSLP